MVRVAVVGVCALLVACAPHDGGRGLEPATLEESTPFAVAPPVEEPVAGCSLRFPDDAGTASAGAVTVTPLREAADWVTRVDAIGGYDHSVAFDPEGAVFWAHDSRHMRFTLAKFEPAGEQRWLRKLEPETLSPRVMRTTSKGSVLVAGTAFNEDGPTLVHVGADGSTLWKTRTPRVSVRAIREVPDGFALLGHSGRAEVTLGPDTLRNAWTDVASSMDVLSILSNDGEFVRSEAFIPGALAMERGTDGLYVAGNFGRVSADYGNGATAGPGVLAKFDLSGQLEWTRGFGAGLYGVANAGPDVVTFGFASRGPASMGGPPSSGASAAWIDSEGCYRGSLSTGDGLARIVSAPDGSVLVYFLASRTDTWQLGHDAVSVPAGQWVVAKLSEDLQLQWAHSVECDGLHAAAGPRGETAVSCYRSLSDEKPLVRRYSLLVRAG